MRLKGKKWKGARRPSSENNNRKSRSWIQRPADVIRTGNEPRPAEAHIDTRLCVAGHSSPYLSAFLAKYRLNYVPQHAYGKKGRA